MTEFLLSKGTKPDEGDGDNITPLAWAVIANRVEVMQALLKDGADINHVDKLGMTPLLTPLR